MNNEELILNLFSTRTMDRECFHFFLIGKQVYDQIAKTEQPYKKVQLACKSITCK